jgi:hypothetical protein
MDSPYDFSAKNYQGNPTYAGTSKFTGSFLSNPINSKVLLPTDIKKIQLTKSFTISIFVKNIAFTSYGGIAGVMLTSGQSNFYGFGLYTGASAIVQVGQSDGTNAAVITSSTKVLSVGKWVHITATWDGNTHRLYWNGVIEKTAACSRVPGYKSSGQQFPIGCNYTDTSGATHLWQNQLRSLRIFDKALTPQQVRKLYEFENSRTMNTYSEILFRASAYTNSHFFAALARHHAA